jgi:hypothetical protein
MHFGFWLDSVVEEFAFQQLRYITNEGSFHKALREEAVADMPLDYRVDPQNPAIPAGKILNLSREKEKEVYALMETVRGNPRLRLVFSNEDQQAIRRSLESDFPEVFATIERWSMRYKLTLEDLDVLSDTDEYLADLRKGFQNNSVISEGMITNIYRAYLKIHGPENATLEAVQRRDPNLFSLLRSLARSLAAEGLKVAQGEIPESAISEWLPAVLGRLDTLDRSDAALRMAARLVIRQYPEIKTVLMVSKMQVPLREDAHHLIVPLQRRIDRLMLEAGRPFVGTVLEKAEDVFDLSLEEFAALLKERDPHFVALSFKRWPLLLQAEKKLQSSWTVRKEDLARTTSQVDELWASLTYENNGQGYLDNRGFIQDKGRAVRTPEDLQLPQKFEPVRQQSFAAFTRLNDLPAAIKEFEARTGEATDILDRQFQAATWPGVKEYYRVEQLRLKQRVEDLKAKLERETS